MEASVSDTLPSNKSEWRKLISFIYELVIVFLIAFLFSQSAPFFPAEGQKKQLSKTQIGLVFAMLDVSAGITCLFISDSIKGVWIKPLLLIGFSLHGLGGALFGLMGLVTHSWLFFIGCCCIQILLGVCTALNFVTAFALANSWYPNKTSRVTGFQQSSFSLGLMAGPGVGGVPYQWGGYILPFVIPGVIKLFLALVATFVLLGFQEPEKPGQRKESQGPSEVQKMQIIFFFKLN